MFGFSRDSKDFSSRLMALDMVKANVMIADDKLNITYMNPATVSLLREAEADLKKELPRFSVDSLIGSNIDVFHKNPDHQRRLLSSLEKTHAATIRLGRRVFDLVITPLVEGGKRTGFVVEWADARERFLNFDYAAKMTAIGRTQAIVEFDVDGHIIDANDMFLKVVGYRIEEIRGKHHNLFVEEAYKNSTEYRDFWDNLKKGAFQAAQFKRISKSGKPVWIEGAYNPIFDIHGKVTKIVKYATDVTGQVMLLNELKTLLDRNFGEIDGALGQSMAEARSATGAADDTLSNVQTVAAAAEQLAASINEISESMSKSRASVDQAFERSVAVGESTGKLTAAAQAMNGIVDLIRNIANQINLLALNATIEAARAGEAGKGFAVVASEVKNLANQSARATEQISQEIDGIQVTSTEVATALSAIRDAIGVVREYVTGTASAVEEQNAVTRSMSANMQSASAAVSTVTGNISGISSAVTQVAQAVTKTRQAAEVLVR
jgi:PAS domain S-box-containing protein